MRQPNTPGGAANVLRNAIRHGLIKPWTLPGWTDPISRKLGGYLLEHPRETKDPDLQRPYQNPKSQVYYEHHFPVVTQPGANPLPEWAVELARFPVPFGHMGVLKSLEQYLWNDQQTITQTANWGIPTQVPNIPADMWI